MTTYDLYIEVPKMDGLQSFWVKETDDHDYVAEWVRGASIGTATMPTVKTGYLLTAKHKTLGVKRKSGAEVEQIECFGRVMVMSKGKKTKVAICNNVGISDSDMAYLTLPEIGVKSVSTLARYMLPGVREIGSDISGAWKYTSMRPDTFIQLGILAHVPFRLLVLAVCRAIRVPTSTLRPNEIWMRQLIDDIEAMTTTGDVSAAISGYVALEDNVPSSWQARAIDKLVIASSTTRDLENAVTRAWYSARGEENEAMLVAVKAIVTIPEVVHALISRGHTRK